MKQNYIAENHPTEIIEADIRLIKSSENCSKKYCFYIIYMFMYTILVFSSIQMLYGQLLSQHLTISPIQNSTTPKNFINGPTLLLHRLGSLNFLVEILSIVSYFM